MATLSLARLSFLLVLSGLSTHAYGVPEGLPKRTATVNDYAGALDAATRDRITALSNELYAKANARITVLTIRSLNGEDISSYSNEVFKAWGIGKKGNDRGVLIVLSVDDRRYRVEVGYGLESILPDGKVGGFGREAVPLFKQNQYGPALELLTDRIAAVIAEDSKVALASASPSATPVRTQAASGGRVLVGTKAFGIVIIFLALAFFFMILMIVLAIKLAKRGSPGPGSSAWISTPGPSSDSFSSSDSGGSSDSGSSGGFDGGSSGGGGADGSF